MSERGTRNIRYATDLVTFYNPAWWGGSGDLDSIAGLFGWGEWTPERFWNRILDDVKAAGLDGIELTFHPGDWRSALEAIAVADHDLEVCSGFLSTRVDGGKRQLDVTNLDHHAKLAELVETYAAFLEACNCKLIVATLPLRRDRDADPPLSPDARIAQCAADGLHRADIVAAARHDVGLALARTPPSSPSPDRTRSRSPSATRTASSSPIGRTPPDRRRGTSTSTTRSSPARSSGSRPSGRVSSTGPPGCSCCGTSTTPAGPDSSST